MSKPLKFVVLFGIASLFADVTYEGARSITGPYLSILGGNATVVGFVAGFGEMIGYGFRLISGYFTDRTQKYWFFAFFGYVMALLSIPLLALTGSWQMAAALIIIERFGKAIRTPSKDAMLSYATKDMGRGFGFGLHNFMDQLGAIAGPLIVSAILFYQGTYQIAFAALLIPAICALSMLTFARMQFPAPQNMEIKIPSLQPQGLTYVYWMGITASSLVAAGFIDFALIAYHFQKGNSISVVWIPIFYSVAMGSNGFASLILGRLYDYKGIIVLIISTILSTLFVPLVFIDGFYPALIGMLLWGIGSGAQSTIMRAVVASIIAPEKRAIAYGIFNICFGISWFLGSFLMGFLYEISLTYLMIFSILIQLSSIPLFVAILVKSKAIR